MAETAETEWEVSRKSVQEKIMIVIESLHSTSLEVFMHSTPLEVFMHSTPIEVFIRP